MQSGTIIIYREHNHLALGIVHKSGAPPNSDRVEIIAEDGKKQALPAERILFDCRQTLSVTLPPAELKKRLHDLHQQITVQSRTVNLRDLWELLQEESNDAWPWEELASLLLSKAENSLATAGVLAALCSPNLYFKEKKAGFFAPRDAKSIEDTLHQQQVEQERQRAYGEFLAWIRAGLASGEAPPPSSSFERYLDLIKGLALHGEMYDKRIQAQRIIEESGFRGKGHPWDVAFQLLVGLGVWAADEELSVLRYRIPTRFPVEVLQAADATPEFVPTSESGEDLTRLFTLTIDDTDTSDIDDALSVSEENGQITVGVHITDVGYFVPLGGPIDEAALARGTSVYLPRGKLAMLPSVLSEEKASLVAGTLRPTLNFFATFNADGQLQAERICRGYIRVGQRLSYDEADALLLSDSDTPAVQTLRRLLPLAQARRAWREAQGAIIIEGDEVKVKVNDGEVKVSVLSTDFPSRMLVGECMILANEMAARYCWSHRLPALYIAQPPPDEPIPDPQSLPSPRVYVHAARRLVKPSQIGVTPASHSALGVEFYTQVTSPLRRYHDLQMQHQLKQHLTHGTPLFDEARLQGIAAGAQESSSAAKRCERESTRYWLLRALERRKGQTVTGHVVREQHGRAFIELDETLLVVSVSASPPLPLGTSVSVVLGHIDARRDILTVRVA